MNPNSKQSTNPAEDSEPKIMTGKDLRFRQESMRNPSRSGPGEMTLAVPLPFAWYSAAAACLTGMIVAFLWLGTYTSTEKAEAVIVTEGGLVPITKDVEGTVEKIHVQEGDVVRVGTPLVDLRVAGYSVLDSDPDRILRSGESDDVPGVDTKVEVVKSPVDGIVYQLPLRVGNSYKNHMALAVIARSGKPSVSALVSAKAKSALEVGDKVALALQGEEHAKAKLSGHVTSVAMSPNEQFVRETRTTFRAYRVDIAIDTRTSSKHDETLIGKTVEIRLPLQKRRIYQWLFDPLRALFGTD
jgi:HlyD family secretion protein